ncbi:hypothetical protein B0I35DRAFT_477441 [Stachybotrys elegans]|uniref:Uncharacterized protein n=1 Tax=Stachybotrys elegans TaxID=80388 RepID=A0A8K0WS49_9HYPO|nr:hypothetical protein B0I35DRAFT_477441 [Stachybotrys elegans]
METTPFQGTGYVLQPRINIRRTLVTEDNVTSKLATRQEAEECVATGAGNACERPITIENTRLPIILGIVIPLVAILIAIGFLYRRNIRRQRMEDAKDPNQDLDFGLDEGPMKKSKRKSILGFGEKQLHRPGQLSMDMNLSSPYLLPPGAHQSQESIHTLARGLPNPHDPYRLVHAGSDAGSIRSFNPNRDPSLYSRRTSVITGRSAAGTIKPAPRTNSLPKQPMSPTTPMSPYVDMPYPPEPAAQKPARHSMVGSIKEPVVPEVVDSPYPSNTNSISNNRHSDELHMPDVQTPPAALTRDPLSRQASPAPPTLLQRHQESDFGGFDLDFPKPGGSPRNPEPVTSDRTGPSSPTSASQPQIRTSVYSDEYRPQYDDDGPQQSTKGQEPASAGLAVPAQSNKRLSVGFRPLPPDEVTESEDPEYRANRIRSFYKEYFDDSQAGPVPEMPEMPRGRQGGGDYYEDYDAGYLGDATYYDADSNAFVMPYAQPVTRRAMTPPPAGRRPMPGPGGPRGPRGAHGPHGSMGGMNMPGGPRRLRAGSAAGPRGSGTSSAFGPRPDSSASGRMMGRMQPKRKGPPPGDLTTLPTPSKLKDDSFAIINAADFAPPTSYKDQVAGRSQSPFGERRPYQQPSIPVSSPLVTAFDELGAIPSPHSLRKSFTFTNLDFAPPKKFKDSDTMSDAGSIRSNRSGISNTQLNAIRSGAGRVSRLPEDTVFTQAALENQLKPNWGIRP